MPIIEKLLEADKEGSVCSHYGDIKDCKCLPEYIIKSGSEFGGEFGNQEVLLCSYCVVILFGEITFLLKSDREVEVEVVGGKETELKMPVYTFQCKCGKEGELFGGSMVRHLRDVHGMDEEKAYAYVEELIK